MAPEYPPELVIFDARFEGEKLKGHLHYIEVPIGHRLRVRWDAEREPESFLPVGGGVAYVFKTDQLQVLPVSRDSIPDDLGSFRYRWSEGLNSGIPWMMFVLILPSGHTLAAAEPKPARAKLFQGRLALYWILNGDDFGRTKVVCTLSAFDGSASSKLVELNQSCSGESLPSNGSIQIEDGPQSTSKVVFISYSHDSPKHSDRVLSLAWALRENGIDVDLDQFHNEEIVDWPRWCNEQISREHTDFVLCVCTAEYRRRIEGKVPPEKGKGAYWEGSLLDDDLYDEKGNSRLVPILLDEEPESSIPRFLRGWTHCRMDRFALTDAGYEHLVRILTRQKKVEKNPLGAVPVLATKRAPTVGELNSPQEFVDDRVRHAAIDLHQARVNKTLTVRGLIGTLDRLFERATFRGEPSVGLCPTQEWDYRLHGALQTLRLMQHYESFVEAEAHPAWERYRELVREVSRYCERMAAYLFDPPVGLSELRRFVGTDEFIGMVHQKKKWFEGGADSEICEKIDPPLENAIRQMEMLYDDFWRAMPPNQREAATETRSDA